jgi:hypothetical protein
LERWFAVVGTTDRYWDSLELISFALTGRTFGADTKRFVSDFPWRER